MLFGEEGQRWEYLHLKKLETSLVLIRKYGALDDSDSRAPVATHSLEDSAPNASVRINKTES